MLNVEESFIPFPDEAAGAVSDADRHSPDHQEHFNNWADWSDLLAVKKYDAR